MRIAFIGQKGIPATYGGIEDFTENVAVRLAERGHQVTVYCRPYYSACLQEYGGVKLRHLRSIATKHLDAISHTLLCSLDSLRRDFEIIVYQGLGPCSVCFIPRLRGRAKVVTIIHALDWQRKKWGRLARSLLKTAEFPAVRFPDRVVAISEALRSHFESRFKKRVWRITPGVGAPVFREPEGIKKFGLDKDNYILYLGRLVPEKGCHYLISAFEAIDTDLKLFLGGNSFFSDDYVHRLRSQASSRVIFGGYVSEKLKQELLSNAYLYVLPSELEGLPQSVIEALSYGRCVLVSDIPANLETCGNHGYTFRNKDVNDLRKRLTELIINKEAVTGGQEKRKEYVTTHFSWDKTVDDLEALFKDCLSNSAAVPANAQTPREMPRTAARQAPTGLTESSGVTDT